MFVLCYWSFLSSLWIDAYHKYILISSIYNWEYAWIGSRLPPASRWIVVRWSTAPHLVDRCWWSHWVYWFRVVGFLVQIRSLHWRLSRRDTGIVRHSVWSRWWTLTVHCWSCCLGYILTIVLEALIAWSVWRWCWNCTTHSLACHEIGLGSLGDVMLKLFVYLFSFIDINFRLGWIHDISLLFLIGSIWNGPWLLGGWCFCCLSLNFFRFFFAVFEIRVVEDGWNIGSVISIDP